MHRRRDTNQDMDDNVQLVNKLAGDGTNSQVSNDAVGTRTRIIEETHVVPRRLSMLRRRIITKAGSPKGKQLYWWASVSLLGLLSFLFVLVPLLVEKTLDKQDCSDYEGQQGDTDDLPYFYTRETGFFEVCHHRKLVLQGNLGVNRDYISEVKVNVFTHSMESTLNITHLQTKPSNCLVVQWLGLSSVEAPLQDCYKFDDAYWYGAYEHQNQHWPINMSVQEDLLASPFLPHDYLSDPFTKNAFGPILHPLWLNTDGVGILVDKGVHLHVSMNGTQLCLVAQPFELECAPDALEYTFLDYTICAFDTVAQTARFFLKDSMLIPRPPSTPSPSVFQKPIWSTWAEFKSNLTTQKIANFCSRITAEKYNASQLEIDDGYSPFYGELQFKSEVNITDLSSSACHNFVITAWVHPFVNYDASNFKQGLMDGTFLPGVSKIEGDSVSLVKWWHGYGAVINFLNHTVVQNYNLSLQSFKESNNLSSFKFDAGEYTYLPKCIHIEGLQHPGQYTTEYVQFVGSLPYHDRAEVRDGFFTQDEPVFVRLLDRTSTWDTSNGLKSVLNAILSVGLGGYTFVMPDMIGGNGETANTLNSTVKPSAELYVRWAQLTTFLPVMQFSITPWGYGEKVNNHIIELTRLHLFLEFDKFANESLITGFPIIRPVWWRAVHYNDNDTWTISDQFFIGDMYMVAPILSERENHRTVYFPLGSNYSLVNTTITAKSTGEVFSGGTSRVFNVTLYEVLYFQLF